MEHTSPLSSHPQTLLRLHYALTQSFAPRWLFCSNITQNIPVKVFAAVVFLPPSKERGNQPASQPAAHIPPPSGSIPIHLPLLTTLRRAVVNKYIPKSLLATTGASVGAEVAARYYHHITMMMIIISQSGSDNGKGTRRLMN